MNLNDLKRELDALTNDVSSEYLKTLLLECASKLPRNERREFLYKARMIVENDLDANKRFKQYEQRTDLITLELFHLRIGEARIYAELNFEDDGSFDQDDEYCYIDYDGVCEKIEEAIQLIYECYEFGFYRFAYMIILEMNELLDHIMVVFMDFLDEKQFDIYDLLHYDLLWLPMSFEDLITMMCACAYHTVAKEDRPKALYEILMQYNRIPVSFEAILQKANVEYEESQVFLKEWIPYINKQMFLINRKAAKSSFALIEDEAYCCSIVEQFERKYSKINRKYTNKLKSNES